MKIRLGDVQVGQYVVIAGKKQKVIANHPGRMLDMPWTHLTLEPPEEGVCERSVWPNAYSGHSRNPIEIEGDSK